MADNFSKPPPPVERKSAQEAMAESASRPLDFDAKERTEFLKTAFTQVMELQNTGASVAEIRAAVPILAERFPELFKKITTPGTDLTPLHQMMNMLQKIGDGEVSHHNASIKIGAELASKYIPSNLRR
jgi:hypothetical protein